MNPAKIPHIESEVKVYCTRDFNRFKNITGNRQLNDGKIKRIIKEIEAGLDMLKYCPIIVDKEMNVIDGQHRLWVARKLKSNIWYVISDKLSLHQIASINTNTERWKAKDFIHCYEIQGNPHYATLREFMEKYHFPLTLCIVLLASGKTNEAGANKTRMMNFEKGLFEADFCGEAEELAELVIRFKAFPGHTSRAFIDAIAKIKAADKCDFDILLEKFPQGMDRLKDCPNTKTMMEGIETIYNLRNSIRRTIF